MPYYSKLMQQDVKVKDLSSSYNSKYTAQGKKKVGLQINCCQYKETQMQFNSASDS